MNIPKLPLNKARIRKIIKKLSTFEEDLTKGNVVETQKDDYAKIRSAILEDYFIVEFHFPKAVLIRKGDFLQPAGEDFYEELLKLAGVFMSIDTLIKENNEKEII